MKVKTGQCAPGDAGAIDRVEEWRDIPGWEGYYSVSDRGRIRRDKPGGCSHVGKILAPGYTRGYPLYVLYGGGRRETVYSHKLVAVLWVGPKPSPAHEVDHVNCIKTDNAPSNLEWVTKTENRRRSHANGLDPRGSAHGRAILNEECVKVVRFFRRRNRVEGKLLAAIHGVAETTISAVVHGHNWGWM